MDEIPRPPVPTRFAFMHIAPAVGMSVAIFCVLFPIAAAISQGLSRAWLTAEIVVAVINIFLGFFALKSNKTVGILVIISSVLILSLLALGWIAYTALT
jgi:hypothetical protein